MCGICGFSWQDAQLATRMAKELAHRGPDDHGIYTHADMSLGFQRLSIIDLSENGRQPMSNEDGTVWIVYNGEVYNHQGLRRELEAKGHRFGSLTDTEVIIHAYEEEGPDCVRRLNGMFAFALWDSRTRTAVLARDRMGIKPLYYSIRNGRLSFASEIKALLQDPTLEREVDPDAVHCYLAYEFVPAPLTMFRGIRKLLPGHYLVWRNGNHTIHRYWDLAFERSAGRRQDLEAELVDRLAVSVRRRLMSDVPLGVFLSGGTDSSAILALMHKELGDGIRTFTLGYADPTFSELPYARMVSKHFRTIPAEILIDPITPEDIETAVWHLDEPMTDLSTIPFYQISRRAKADVTVCLSGEGGDETFAGYERFIASRLYARYARWPGAVRALARGILLRLPDQPQKKGIINMLKRFVDGAELPAGLGHLRWQYFLSPREAGRLFRTEFLARLTLDPVGFAEQYASGCPPADELEREIYVDLRLVMAESILMKVDKMSMAHALEVRVPFLDYEFQEFCATIPPEWKLNGLQTKVILRSALRGLLPPEIVNRKKQGYSIPIKNWLREDLRDYMIDLLDHSPLINECFQPSRIRTLIEEHLSRRVNHNHLLWALINLALWHRMYIEEDTGTRKSVDSFSQIASLRHNTGHYHGNKY